MERRQLAGQALTDAVRISVTHSAPTGLVGEVRVVVVRDSWSWQMTAVGVVEMARGQGSYTVKVTITRIMLDAQPSWRYSSYYLGQAIQSFAKGLD